MSSPRVRLLRSQAFAALAALVSAGLAPASLAVDIDWVSVAKPSACDTQTQGCFGALSAAFRIGEFEITNEQYAEFLNAVAESDPTGLYNTIMAGSLGGITRSGTSGSYSYSVNFERGPNPVNSLSLYDALRFVNWLENGQPSGIGQVAASTEDGSYTFSGPTTVGARNAGAKYVLPGEDEWYKAAYYDPDAGSYWDYPTSTDVQVSCTVPGSTPNTANCNAAVGDTTDVGSYTAADGSNGTFDQGGNVREWTEEISGANRVQRGGDSGGSAVSLSAAFRLSGAPTSESTGLGFRVAQVEDVPVPVRFFVSPNDDGQGGGTVNLTVGSPVLAIWADAGGAASGAGLYSMQDVRFQTSGGLELVGFICSLTPCLVGNPPDPDVEFVFTGGDDTAMSPTLTGLFRVGYAQIAPGGGLGELALVGGTALDGDFVNELLEIEALPNDGIVARGTVAVPSLGAASQLALAAMVALGGAFALQRRAAGHVVN